ncbi:MAG TPA: hypothetical protein PK239_06495 [Chitinophagales bacterium]|nr:hypothetical protein [Chitinophagales bacterium]HRK26925.1 hypothetical protein [Chitinophagales bacterium]
MFKKTFLLVFCAFLLVGSVSCNRSGCPANAEQQAAKKHNKKHKTKSGILPPGYSPSGKKR